MTDQLNNPQEYWYIPVPKAKFPEPKFHYGQQVGLSWEDDRGNRHYDIGEIIAMEYTAQGNQPVQWYYRLRYLKCDYKPSLVGTEDECLEPESDLVPDSTAIEN